MTGSLIVPLLAVALALPALPRGKVDRRSHGLSGMLCDVWTVVSSVVVIIAWAVCDLHFDEVKKLTRTASDNSDAQDVCSLGEACLDGVDGSVHPSVDEVSDAISEHCRAASIVLGTAMVLELLQVIAHRMISRHMHREDEGKKRVHEVPDPKQNSIYVLFGSHDSECLLFVYTLLFFTHLLMSADRGGERLGLIFADPVAAAAGIYRPVSTVRYIEWSIASPTLMALVGRSIPRRGGSVDPELLRPALLVTVSYIFLAWFALPIIDPFWRWTLIFFSFMGWIFSALDQLTSWKRDVQETAFAAQASDVLMKVQMLVYGIYGVIYLLPLQGLIDTISEQTAFTYADATIKLFCSACLSAMRQVDSLATARRERAKADGIASDLRQIIHDANAPIFALDANGNISLWNDKLVKLTGATLSDVMGKPLEDYISEECRSEFLDIFYARKRGKSGTEQYHCDMIVQNERDGRCKGSLVSIIMTATARHDADGHFIGIIGVGSDLTEVTRIKAIEETKNQFMAVVSHELKSPLHGIIGLAESLSQREHTPERKNQLKMIKSCAVRLLDLVMNIMQMCLLKKEQSSDEAGSVGGNDKQSLRKDLIDIPLIIDEVCMLVTNATDKANRPLLNPLVKFDNKVSSQGSRLPIVQGDAYKITQVFYNLLTNACKFCFHGQITVDASVNSSKDRLEVTVTDTGVGINPENMKRIFEPFEQESVKSTRTFGGIGLGLAISKQVVELHGGDVYVQSTPGKGSTFVVSLPVTEDAVALAMLPLQDANYPNIPQHRLTSSDLSQRSHHQQGSSMTSSKRNSNAEKFVILSVDDDVVNQEVIMSTLADQYEVHIAMNGFEAVEFLSTTSKLPDLVLLDVMMPGMDGFEVLKVIRDEKNISPANLPVIMLSAIEPVDKSVIQSLRCGATDYVTKPFDPVTLKARASTAVEMKRLQQVELENFHHSRLLHGILPAHIVERLILGDRSISERHDSVCMLFADIVGWTPMSESVPTTKLIDMLNQLFSKFDELTEKHGVYKADTIGDSYLVAAGHEGHSGLSDSTLRVTEFAIEMLENVKAIKPPNGILLQMRVGIHTGPAYSGVVGTKVPKYTFFGDTVNTAARMEMTGWPGCINMSSSARNALASEVATCRLGRSLEGWLATLGAKIVNRDPIHVKGKGVMELSILCPKGVSPPLATQLATQVSRRRESWKNHNEMNPSFSSLESLDERQPSFSSLVSTESKRAGGERFNRRTINPQFDLVRKEVCKGEALEEEVTSLRNKVSNLEKSKREALEEVEALRAKLQSETIMPAGGNASWATQLMRRGVEDSLTPSDMTSHQPDVSAHLEKISELKLQLLVTTNALTRARQALSEKDDEINQIDLQLQLAQQRAQQRDAVGSRTQRSVATTEVISSSLSTRRNSFSARTEMLLGRDSAPSREVLVARRESGLSGSCVLSSLGDLQMSDHGLDGDLFETLLQGGARGG